MDLPLIVDPAGNTPLYQQLKYQLIYLISSRQLPAGKQLPAIRELAESLQINIGTVAQAYRELQADGLIESVRGRGTFVRAILPPRFTDEEMARQAALTDTLTGALARSFSLGFSGGEIQQRVASLLSQETWRCHLAFVGPTPEIARKHAHLLQENLGVDGVVVHALDLESLLSGNLPAAFELVHYVTTFVGRVHAVEEALVSSPWKQKVLPISTKVSDYTLGALAILPADTRACLIAEERNLHSALNLVTTHSQLPRTIPSTDTRDPDRVSALCDAAAIVIHTFSSVSLLDRLEVPAGKRLELRFEIDPDSVANLRHLLRLTPSPSPVGRT